MNVPVRSRIAVFFCPPNNGPREKYLAAEFRFAETYARLKGGSVASSTPTFPPPCLTELLLLLFNISPSRVKKFVRALQTDRGQHQEGPKRGGLLGRKEPAKYDNDDTCFQIRPAGNVHGIANTTGFQSLERTQTRGPAHEQNTNQPPTYLPPEKSCYPQRKCRLIPARPLPVSGRTQWEGRNPLRILSSGEQSAVHYLRACRR